MTETPEESIVWQRRHMAEDVEHVRSAARSMLLSIEGARRDYVDWLMEQPDDPLRSFDEARLAARIQSAVATFMFNAQLDRLTTNAGLCVASEALIRKETP